MSSEFVFAPSFLSMKNFSYNLLRKWVSPLHATGLFLYPKKTSEKKTVASSTVNKGSEHIFNIFLNNNYKILLKSIF